MIYFEYPLDIHGWKPKPETKPKPEPKNRGRKTNTKPETRKIKTRGYPHRTRSAAISSLLPVNSFLNVQSRKFAKKNTPNNSERFPSA